MVLTEVSICFCLSLHSYFIKYDKSLNLSGQCFGMGSYLWHEINFWTTFQYIQYL